MTNFYDESEWCEVCGEGLRADGTCPNDGGLEHDRIQDELWDERGTEYE